MRDALRSLFADPVRRSVAISLLVLVSILGVGALVAAPLAKNRALAEASKRGLVLQVEDFQLGWFQAELSGVTVSLEGVPEIKVAFEKMLVDFSLAAPRLRQVVASGGQATIFGTLDQVKESVQRWREARPALPAEDRGSAGLSRTEIVRQLDITWIGALGGSEKQFISGLQMERSPAGLIVGADLVEFEGTGVSVQIAGAVLQSPEPHL